MKKLLVKNQLIKVKIDKRTYNHYIKRGYESIDNRMFIVNAEDLTPSDQHKVRVICDYCKQEYETTFCIYTKGLERINKSTCSHCKGKKIKELADININEKFKEFEDLCTSKGYQSLAMEKDYINGTTPLPYICPKHGYKKISYYNLKYHNRGCNQCGREIFKNKTKNSYEYIVSSIEYKNNNKLLNPEEYINATTRNLVVKCGTCNHTFTVSKNNYDKNVTGKCPDCNERSLGEYQISQILNKYNIPYKQQYRFMDCSDSRTLPFDFYLPDYNTCIEFDGQGHYKVLYSEDNLYLTLLHDGMKNNYCKWNNIRLLRIPYFQSKNIEQIITTTLNIA